MRWIDVALAAICSNRMSSGERVSILSMFSFFFSFFLKKTRRKFYSVRKRIGANWWREKKKERIWWMTLSSCSSTFLIETDRNRIEENVCFLPVFHYRSTIMKIEGEIFSTRSSMRCVCRALRILFTLISNRFRVCQ